ncbi:cell division protein FtsQ/DivIB [Pseudidiomarina sp.]|uniref:cell division protein FtsQ/DivIB n=1 Tax=Pseudidiomarina sp. TaxID=2081707 RepID=UPI00299E79ED|nr:cell division protein FtsQ/DivIB [Pseudidiomarina sp.]MDX1705236.1 cell division protein FtsQ/DivIB [Pseudidiomarina sp.]
MAAMRWQFWLGLVFFLSVVVGAIAGSVWLYYLAMDANEVPLRKLVVQGELEYVSRDEVRQALTDTELGSFFSADVDGIRSRIEGLPWVARASVRKEWPDILKVFLVEQQPLAHWNVQQRPRALINAQGEIFEADKAVLTVPLPYLSGPEHALDETLAQFQNVQQLLELNGHWISSLQLSERFAVDVVLQSGIELRLGREGLLERVQRFIDLYPQIEAHRDALIEYVDLRYDTGVAVSWRTAAKQPKES